MSPANKLPMPIAPPFSGVVPTIGGISLVIGRNMKNLSRSGGDMRQALSGIAPQLAAGSREKKPVIKAEPGVVNNRDRNHDRQIGRACEITGALL